MKSIAIIGAGSFGTALSFLTGSAGNDVRIWSRQEKIVDEINLHHTNSARIADCLLNKNVRATTHIKEALKGAEIILLVIPSHVAGDVLKMMLPFVREEMIFVSAIKGIEVETGRRISEIVDEVIGKKFTPRFVCISGPSFAQEIVAGYPTAVVAASDSNDEALIIQETLSVGNFRVYTNDDVVGTEIGGSVKNTMAIAAGMAAGLGFGSNSVAALITRGLSEISWLACAMGGKRETLAGLAGLGDLVLTCTGRLSRNRHVGEELGKGRQLQDIISEMRETAEGVKTTVAVKLLSEKFNVEMPIMNEVYDVLYNQKSAREAVESLMTRPLKEES